MRRFVTPLVVLAGAVAGICLAIAHASRRTG